jgi:hypothetical protein
MREITFDGVATPELRERARGGKRDGLRRIVEGTFEQLLRGCVLERGNRKDEVATLGFGERPELFAGGLRPLLRRWSSRLLEARSAQRDDKYDSEQDQRNAGREQQLRELRSYAIACNEAVIASSAASSAASCRCASASMNSAASHSVRPSNDSISRVR